MIQEQIKSYWPLNKNETSFLFSLLVVSAILFWAIRFLRLNDPVAVQVKSNISIYIDKKMSVNELALKLKKNQVIKNTKDFTWSASINGYKTVQKGHYLLKPGAYTVKDIILNFGLGIQNPVKVTIAPGISMDKIAQTVSAQLAFSKEEFLEFSQNEAALNEIGINTKNLIGRMLPETYYLFWTTSPKQLVQELNASTMKIIESHVSTSTQKLNADQILTLASIVEWEAGNNNEKPEIAGLYLNRMRRRWRLQADPTVNFALGERRRLTYADYELNHPYNTYVIKGLPPGPITNPDETSIKAVLEPSKHKFMYMVATPEGVHDFSIRYEEHQRKSQKWVRWLRQQYRIKAQRERNG